MLQRWLVVGQAERASRETGRACLLRGEVEGRWWQEMHAILASALDNKVPPPTPQTA